MRYNTSASHVLWQALKIVLFVSLLLSLASSMLPVVTAEDIKDTNVSMNGSSEGYNTTLNDGVETSEDINSSNMTSNNSTTSEVTTNLSERFEFKIDLTELKIEEALPDDNATNTTIGNGSSEVKRTFEKVLTGNLTTRYKNQDVFNAVEMNVYEGNITDEFTICTEYINGTGEFECVLDDNFTDKTLERTGYTLIAMASFRNESYEINTTFENHDIMNLTALKDKNITYVNDSSNHSSNTTDDATDENTTQDREAEYEKDYTNKTPKNVSVTKMDKEIKTIGNETTEKSFNLTVDFKEAYVGRHIFGDISIRQDGKEIFETVEIDISPPDEPSNITSCHEEINGTGNFNCTLSRVREGTYNITVSTKHEGRLYTLNEIKYLDVPERSIQLDLEESYVVGDIVEIDPRTFLGDEAVETGNKTLDIDGPDNLSYSLDGEDVDFAFIVDSEGPYNITVQADIYDENIVKNRQIVVLTKNRSYLEDSSMNKTLGDDNISDTSSIDLTSIEFDYDGYHDNLRRKYLVDADMDYRFNLFNLSSYNISPEMLDMFDRNPYENLSSSWNVSVEVETPNNMSYQFMPSWNEERQAHTIDFQPFITGKHILRIDVENYTIYKNFRVYNKSGHARDFVERAILRAKENFGASVSRRSENVSSGDMLTGKTLANISEKDLVERDSIRPNKILDVVLRDVRVNNDSYDLDLEFNGSKVFIENLTDIEGLGYMQSMESNDTRFATPVFAIDAENYTQNKSLNLTGARLSLEKKTPGRYVDRILYCEDWNYSSAECVGWKDTNISFIQNKTHVSFNVTHFTAYTAGTSSGLEIWDTADEDKDNKTALVTKLINFTANYTDSDAGDDPISDGTCNITLNNTPETTGRMTYNLSYSSADGLYWFNKSFEDNGYYDYVVNCSSPSEPDTLSLQDNVSIYSQANISDLSVLDISLGEETEIESSAVDNFNLSGLDSYPVSFYSDKEGFIGKNYTNSSGTTIMKFTPSISGQHIITANITDNVSRYYLANDSEDTVLLDVVDDSIVYGNLSMKKWINETTTSDHDVSLEITNMGDTQIQDITIGDYLPDMFNLENPSRTSDWNISTSSRKGKIFYWNITQMDPQEKVKVEYVAGYNSTTNTQDINDMYLFGLTYGSS